MTRREPCKLDNELAAPLGRFVVQLVRLSKKKKGKQMIEISESDTEFQTSTVEKAEACSRGWDVRMANGWSMLVPIDKCVVNPKPGEEIRLYGRGTGYPVRGIVIGGRVYSYQTPADHDVSQAAMRERMTREREERDSAFRAAPKPPLAAFKVNDAKAWAECVRVQSADPYSFACLKFAAAWASLMEERGELGDTPTPVTAQKVSEIAQTCSREADTESITGFMYGAAVSCLSQLWVHGEALRRWHNKDTQIDDEGDKANESGGVLNPALLSVGARTGS